MNRHNFALDSVVRRRAGFHATICSFYFFAIVAVTIPGRSKTVADTSATTSLVVPDDWQLETLPGYLLAAQDANKRNVACIRSYPSEADAFSVSDHISALKNDLHEQTTKNGYNLELVGQGELTLDGMPACFIHGKLIISDSQTANLFMYEVATGDQTFRIDLTSFDPASDSDLETIAASFRVEDHSNREADNNVTITRGGVILQVPKQWVADSVSGRLFSAHSPSGLTQFELLSFPSNDTKSAYNEYVENKIREIRGTGPDRLLFTTVSTRTLKSLSALFLEGNYEAVDLGKNIFFRAYAVDRNGQIYVLALASTEHVELYRLQTIANSLQFGSAPSLSTSLDDWIEAICTGVALLLVLLAVVLAVRERRSRGLP